MSSLTTVTLVGAKGGVGTSTVAALHATQLARLGRTVRLSANDSVDDLAAIVGVPCPAPNDIAKILPGLTLAGAMKPPAGTFSARPTTVRKGVRHGEPTG